MVIDQVVLDDPPSVPLVDDDDMIEALSADRADEPLGKGVLPRRARRGPDLGDAHIAQAALHGLAEDPIVVVDQERGAKSNGKASFSCLTTHADEGAAVTLKWTKRRRA